MSSVLVVSRIPDVSLGHDGLCFETTESFFSWSEAYVAQYTFVRAGKLAGTVACAIRVSISVLFPALEGLVVLRCLRREHRHG